MVEITHQQLRWATEECRKHQVSMFVSGAPGIGKSESIWAGEAKYAKLIGRQMRDWNSFTIGEKEKLATDEEYNAQFHIVADLRAATMTETDLVGLPDFTASKEFVEFKPRLLARVLSMPKASGCMLNDEVNQGSKPVQNSMFKTFQDRCIGDVKLNDNILILGAGNRAQDKASITQMSGPLGTRMLQFELLCPTGDEYIEYNLNSEYPNPYITGYIKSYSDQVYRFEPSSKDMAFPNPRSIQRLAKMMNDKPMKTDEDIRRVEILAKASCGEVWGTKFIAYARMSRKVDIDAVLNNPESVKEYIGQLDLKYSVIGAIAYKCKDKFKENIEKSLMVLNFLDEESGVFGVRVIKQYVGQSKLISHLRKSDVWEKHLSDRFGKYINDSLDEA